MLVYTHPGNKVNEFDKDVERHVLGLDASLALGEQEFLDSLELAVGKREGITNYCCHKHSIASFSSLFFL